MHCLFFFSNGMRWCVKVVITLWVSVLRICLLVTNKPYEGAQNIRMSGDRYKLAHFLIYSLHIYMLDLLYTLWYEEMCFNGLMMAFRFGKYVFSKRYGDQLGLYNWDRIHKIKSWLFSNKYSVIIRNNPNIFLMSDVLTTKELLNALMTSQDLTMFRSLISPRNSGKADIYS